jgi:hypothetical protein
MPEYVVKKPFDNHARKALVEMPERQAKWRLLSGHLVQKPEKKKAGSKTAGNKE